MIPSYDGDGRAIADPTATARCVVEMPARDAAILANDLANVAHGLLDLQRRLACIYARVPMPLRMEMEVACNAQMDPAGAEGIALLSRRLLAMLSQKDEA